MAKTLYADDLLVLGITLNPGGSRDLQSAFEVGYNSIFGLPGSYTTGRKRDCRSEESVEFLESGVFSNTDLVCAQNWIITPDQDDAIARAGFATSGPDEYVMPRWEDCATHLHEIAVRGGIQKATPLASRLPEERGGAEKYPDTSYAHVQFPQGLCGVVSV